MNGVCFLLLNSCLEELDSYLRATTWLTLVSMDMMSSVLLLASKTRPRTCRKT